MSIGFDHKFKLILIYMIKLILLDKRNHLLWISVTSSIDYIKMVILYNVTFASRNEEKFDWKREGEVMLVSLRNIKKPNWK